MKKEEKKEQRKMFGVAEVAEPEEMVVPAKVRVKKPKKVLPLKATLPSKSGNVAEYIRRRNKREGKIR